MPTATKRWRPLAVLIVCMLGLAACQAESYHDETVRREQVTASVAPIPTAPTSSPSRVSTPQPVAPVAKTPSKSQVARQAISMAKPLQLTAPRIGLDASVDEYSKATLEQRTRQTGRTGVYPPMLDRVSWWSGNNAGIPGTDATNTVYFYGHTWREPAVFNRIKELRFGDDVYVTTGNGRLHYVVVEEPFTVSKPDFSSDPRVTLAKAGRLIMVGCYRETGKEFKTTENVVVALQMKK